MGVNGCAVRVSSWYRSSSRCLLVDASGPPRAGLLALLLCSSSRAVVPALAGLRFAPLGLASRWPRLLGSTLPASARLLGSAPLAPSCSGSSSRCRGFAPSIRRRGICSTSLLLSCSRRRRLPWRSTLPASAPSSRAGAVVPWARLGSACAGTDWPRLRSVVPSPHAGAVLLVGWRRGSAPTVSELVLYLCCSWPRAGAVLLALAGLCLCLCLALAPLRRAVGSAPSIRRRARLGSVSSSSRWCSSPRLGSAPLGSARLRSSLAGWRRLGSAPPRAVPASWSRLVGRSIASTPQLFRASAGLGKHQS